MKHKPILSVIIPAYNEEKDIGQCLASLMIQDYPNYEVIVVDDGSIDNTKNIVTRFTKLQNFKLINGEHKGPGFSRNLGAKSSKGEILVFVDCDMLFPKDYLSTLVKPILENVIGTAEETQIVTNSDNIWSRCLGKVITDKSMKERIIFRAIKKDEFFKMGGFDPKYGYADDKTFWFKYQVKSVIAPGCYCYHKNPSTLKEVYKQSKWVGTSVDNFLTRGKIKYITPIIALILFPLLVAFLAIKWTIRQRNPLLFFPMIPFTIVKAFGMIIGMFKGIYKNQKTK